MLKINTVGDIRFNGCSVKIFYKMNINKLKFLIVFFLLPIVSIIAQDSKYNVTMKFKDGKVISDSVISKINQLKSITSKKEYGYSKIDEIIVHINNQSYPFYILEVRERYNPKKLPRKGHRGIGYKVYDSPKLELFYISFSSSLDRVIRGVTYKYNPKQEIFIRRKNEKFVYSIGCMDGIGCVKFLIRLKAFFYDCPKLIAEIKQKRIDERDIIKISNFYDVSCN
jgi:hypothetical protein